jgi:hypothetical protein
MINFFRKIRRQLANENKFQRYFRYAFGEVALIMIGIFMALQLNNWNEKRKQEIQFKATVEQLYNTITDEVWNFEFETNNAKNIVSNIDTLLNYNDSMPKQVLPMALWFSTFSNKDGYASASLQIINNLNYNTENKEQINLAKQLQNYATLITNKTKTFFKVESQINKLLLDNNIPFPKLDLDNSHKGLIADSTHYNNEDYDNCVRLLKDPNFRSHLKSQRTQVAFNSLDFKVLYNDANAMLKLIKKYDPEVKLLFQDVGIIGKSIDGFDDIGAHSTPMTLINEDKSIWEIEIYLKEGRVKFRCRDSWAQNWGGTAFPTGEANFEGPDISVNDAGNYRVVLNLSASTYEFIKLEDEP